MSGFSDIEFQLRNEVSELRAEIWRLESELEYERKSHVTVGEVRKRLGRMPKKLVETILEELSRKSVSELKDTDLILF